MDMQDKEFDQLFSSKLNDLEIEPSKVVWQNITRELGGKQRKTIVPFLSIAASIIVLIGAGIAFYPKSIRVIKPEVKGQVARVQPVKTALVASIVKQQAMVQVPKTIVVSANKTVRPHIVINNKLAPIIQKQLIIAKNDVRLNTAVPQILTAEASPNIIQQTTVIDSVKAIAALAAIHQVNKQELTVTINSNLPAKSSDTTPVKKHRIHSFGDMLNVAIAAVDKHNDKVIKFQDGDDD